MKIVPIKDGIAVRLEDIDITTVDQDTANQIRQILKEKVIVVIKKQDTAPAYFTKFVNKLGSVSNYVHFAFDPITGENKYTPKPDDGLIDPDSWPDPKTYPVQRVTGQKYKGQATGIFGEGILDWHSNLNGLDRADGVALQGYKGVENTSTTWLNTTVAYNEMPEDLKSRCENVYSEYEYSPEIWSGDQETIKCITTFKGDGRVQKGKTFYKMWLIQKNIIGNTGIYFYTNNRCKIISEDTKLYDDLKDYMFQEKYMYQHFYEEGDIVLSDQLLSLHKRDQNDPEILAKRILHRITFKVSNTKKPYWIVEQNKDLIEQTTDTEQ